MSVTHTGADHQSMLASKAYLPHSCKQLSARDWSRAHKHDTMIVSLPPSFASSTKQVCTTGTTMLNAESVANMWISGHVAHRGTHVFAIWQRWSGDQSRSAELYNIPNLHSLMPPYFDHLVWMLIYK
jgi:hypothetical protein